MVARLLALTGERATRTVAVYAALGREADPSGAVATWVAAGITVAWPRVVGAELRFHSATGLDGLAVGYRGILEPSPDAPAVAVEAIDLLVVPGVGFDRRGGRLGQGGGFYDRLLAAPGRRALAVGLGFAVQLVDEVPTEAHDQRLDAVITERELWLVGPRGETPSGRGRSGVE